MNLAFYGCVVYQTKAFKIVQMHSTQNKNKDKFESGSTIRNGKLVSRKKQIKNKVFRGYHHICALDENKLRKTDMVKHVMELIDEKPFHNHYQRIPPHQFSLSMSLIF